MDGTTKPPLDQEQHVPVPRPPKTKSIQDVPAPDPYLEGIAKRWSDWATPNPYLAPYWGWPQETHNQAWLNIFNQIEQDMGLTYHAPTKTSHVLIPRRLLTDEVLNDEGADIIRHFATVYPSMTVHIFHNKDASLIRIEHETAPNE